MLSNQLVKSLIEDPKFQEFLVYALDTIDNYGPEDIEKLSDKRAGEEVKSIIRAKKLVSKIFAQFTSFNEKKEPTTEQIQGAKNKYAL